MDLNNRRTGKDATKPRAPGLLGQSVITKSGSVILYTEDSGVTNIYMYIISLEYNEIASFV